VPVGTRPVGDREGFDFREGHAIGDLFVDHAFTDLDFGPADGASADGAPADGASPDGASADGAPADGAPGEAQEARVTATVTAPDGHGVTMSWGRELPWVQVHTADRPEPENDRVGLAVEPMTCPPDAFNSGHDLVLLAPGESHAASWTITAF
jgi:aldose 1-epimerase